MKSTVIEQLQKNLDSKTAYLIEDWLNLRYLTETNITEGVLIITHSSVYFLTDSRYIESAKKQLESSNAEVVLQEKYYADIAKILSDNNAESVKIELENVSVGKFNRLAKEFEKSGITVDGNDGVDKIINEFRAVKTDDEIEKMRAAQKLTDDAFTHILPFIKEGVCERDIALEIEFFMRKNGAGGVSFNLITITGKKTSMPHGIPSYDKIKNGDFFTMDIGCKYDGYCSDMTRTVAVGQPSDEMKKVYNTVLQAQSATLSMLKAGVKCSNADKAARDIIYGAGFEGCFGHSTGHSVGLFIHESPNLSQRSKDTLKSGNVVTVEPGIYLEDKFGVRIEDMVVIRENGIENLTKSEKNLIIL